jgi:hypothetical protein
MDFWQKLTDLLDFTGITTKETWQGIIVSVFLGVIFIPLAFYITRILITWFDNKRPLKQLLKNFLDTDKTVYIFVSQKKPAEKISDNQYQS